MRVSVLAVGTELLLGEIIDSNSAWIGQHLAIHGMDSLVQIKVGDNVDRIAQQLRMLLDDADAVIITGGLGPTHDDLTREAIAEVMGVDLVLDDEIADVILEMFASRGRRMPANNQRQAMVPVGATIIPQTRGTAPGLICPVSWPAPDGTIDKVVFAVPGVPHEMEDMFERGIVPELQRRSGEQWVIGSTVLKSWGLGESSLNEQLEGVIAELDEVGNPTLAFLASGWNGLKIRLTAKAPTQAEVDQLLSEWVDKVMARVGSTVYATGDATMESIVLDLLAAKGWSLGLAESVTGGLVAGRLTDVPGASQVFRGSVVSYATEVKQSLLDVPPGPVVSEEAALAMAHGARAALGADVGLALTGVAGPDPQEGVKPGNLFVGLVTPEGEETQMFRLPGRRQQMREYSVISALDVLRRAIVD